jgi:hypothetical protein
MKQKLHREEFFEEFSGYIESIIEDEFEGVEAVDVLPELFKQAGGNPGLVDDELIYEIIELVGGTPFDAAVTEDDYEDEENEYDY